MTIEERLDMMGECIARHVEEIDGLKRRLDLAEGRLYELTIETISGANVGPATQRWDKPGDMG
jgi:hypothetical protein